MAKSKYQAELEEFKKNLPKVMQKHIEMNGLDICTPGLKGFYDELGIEWEPPRESYYMYIRGHNFMLPTDPSNGTTDDAAENELEDFMNKVRELGKQYSFWTNNTTLNIDEYYV